ncbi:uncharacterized protein CLUP02_15952 [Colletotrichum lupini]|uniref:Uncharacterized protein n=1 Tax=Colletotrichum lupini TaxID=145971 RepID=A0A9Q8T904_9PEZI|nr:uncharacterized protein CLUP02_15952 [Colletotrichum lupini]UQC90422.1 hypothetical protein CLUP02_15952 [Colletotrichum lupini]
MAGRTVSGLESSVPSYVVFRAIFCSIYPKARFAARFHPPVASAPPLCRRGVPSDRPAAKDPDAPNPL